MSAREEAVDLALVRVTIDSFESRASGRLDGESVAAEAGDLARAAGLLRALLAALDEARGERDQWKQKATDEEAAHALVAGALIGNERSLAKLDRYRVERDQARKERDRLQATLDGLAATVEGMQESHDPDNCSQCDKGAPCDVRAGNDSLDAVLRAIRGRE